MIYFNYSDYRSIDNSNKFVNIQIIINGKTVGSPGEWSHSGILLDEAKKLVDNLRNKEHTISDKNIPEWIKAWVAKNKNSENLRIQFALPKNVEIFDGEKAFIVFGDGEAETLLWQDYESKDLLCYSMALGHYIAEWEQLIAKIAM